MKSLPLFLAAACLLPILSGCKAARSVSNEGGTLAGALTGGPTNVMSPEDIALMLKPPSPDKPQAFDPVWWMSVSAPYLSPKLYPPLSQWMRLYNSQGMGSADRLYAESQTRREQIYFSDARTTLISRFLGGNPLYMHFDLKSPQARVLSQTQDTAEILLSGQASGDSARLIFRNSGFGWQLEDAIIKESGNTWSALTRLRERLQLLQR